LNNKKILITGGTGFIGFHLAKKCLKLNWSVTSLSTKKPKINRRLSKVKYLISDISNKKKLLKSIKPNFYDYVVNLAGYVDHSNKKKTMESHFKGCKNLSLLFLNSKIEKFIQIGSSIEYGKKKSPQIESKINNQKTFSVYGNAKLQSTKFLLNLNKNYNFPMTVLRLYLVYGPAQDNNRVVPITIFNAIQNNNFDCSNGTQLRDFLFIDDLIDAIIKSLKNDKSTGEIINLGTGKPIKIKDLITKICNLVGSGRPEFGKVKLRKDEIKKLYPKILKSKKLLNWKPKISIEKGLKKTIKYFKKNKKKSF
tara:strand:+ start:506 stop:1432 length:927 start_codon:yes stop_codon:yes gene_type:complete